MGSEIQRKRNSKFLRNNVHRFKFPVLTKCMLFYVFGIGNVFDTNVLLFLNCNQKVHKITSFSKETSSQVITTKSIIFQFSQTNSNHQWTWRLLVVTLPYSRRFNGYICKLPMALVNWNSHGYYVLHRVWSAAVWFQMTPTWNQTSIMSANLIYRRNLYLFRMMREVRRETHLYLYQTYTTQPFRSTQRFEST